MEREGSAGWDAPFILAKLKELFDLLGKKHGLVENQYPACLLELFELGNTLSPEELQKARPLSSSCPTAKDCGISTFSLGDEDHNSMDTLLAQLGLVSGKELVEMPTTFIHEVIIGKHYSDPQRSAMEKAGFVEKKKHVPSDTLLKKLKKEKKKELASSEAVTQPQDGLPLATASCSF